ncbi:MAG: HAMP domain-containing protein [Candidatus Kapaibacterium sp.]|nr:MAG: HAMP domain-containing protein [Candidatus Kapabacteria bacterium]
MKWLQNLSIRSKLIGIILLCTVLALVLGFSFIVVKNIRTAKQDMVRSSAALAQVVGDYCTPSLAFQNTDDAEEALTRLSSVTAVRYAAVYDKAGNLFAEFYNDNDSDSKEDNTGNIPSQNIPSQNIPSQGVQKRTSSNILPTNLSFDSVTQRHHKFSDTALALYQKILFKNEYYGVLHLRLSTSELNAEIRSSALQMAGIGAVLTGVSVLLALLLQRVVSRRLLGLAAVMKRISNDNDYSARFDERWRGGDDEIGVLADGFNTMLGQIQKREAERDNAKEALATALREDFRETVRNLQNLVIKVVRAEDNEYYITLFEGKIAAQFGLDTEALRGKTMKGVFGEKLNTLYKQHFDAAFQGKNVRFESFLNGAHYMNALVPVIEQGRVREIVCSTVDISSQKEAEERLRVSEKRYRALVQGLPVGILQSIKREQSSRLEFVNTEFVKQTGYSMEMFAEMLHSGEMRLPMHEEDRTKAESEWQAWLENDADIVLMRTYRLRIVREANKRSSNDFRWFDDYSTKLRTDAGELVIIQALMDVSEKKQSEEQLQKSLDKERQVSALKTRFVSTISHEFRTPLAGILLSVDMLTRYFDRLTTEKRLSELSKIRLRVNELTDLMNDFLSQSESQNAAGRFNPKAMDIAELCRNISTEMEFIASATSRARIVRNINVHEAMINGDMKLLRYVVRNLVTNAIKYSPKDAPIMVDVYCETAYVVISVQDKGIGIPEADISGLFTPFFRASNTTTISGTGIGLSIVKEFVEAHGGTVSVASRMNEGSIFTVRLPLLSAEAAQEARRTAA